MAIRLSKAFGGSAESWLIQQKQYDIWQVMQKADDIKVKAFVQCEFLYARGRELTRRLGLLIASQKFT